MSEAIEDDDFKMAVRTLLLTAPHMSRDQLNDVVELGRELLRTRDHKDGRRLFAQAADRPEEARSFEGGEG